jgi:hypothetical protein
MPPNPTEGDTSDKSNVRCRLPRRKDFRGFAAARVTQCRSPENKMFFRSGDPIVRGEAEGIAGWSGSTCMERQPADETACRKTIS